MQNQKPEMLTNMLTDDLPLLDKLQIPFTVIRGNKDITNMVEVDISDEKKYYDTLCTVKEKVNKLCVAYIKQI